MKKYVYLFLSTLIITATIIMSGFMFNGQTAEADVLVLKLQNMDNTISASGKLQYKSAYSVKSKNTGIMDILSVKNGSEVQEGDLLYSFYKIEDAYTAMISQYTGGAGSDTVLSMLSQYGSTEDIINEIKKYCPVENVYAEKSGRVTGIKYAQNDLIEKNGIVLKITEKDTLEIPVNINENYISQIKKGQRADVVFNAVSGKHFSAEVTNIASEATVTSGLTGKETTVEVTLTMRETDDSLRVGYSAACTIITSTDENIIVVPYDAVRTEDDKSYVFIAKNGFAVKTEIETGKEYKDGIEIKRGLMQDDMLILNSEALQDGQKITIHDRTVQPDA